MRRAVFLAGARDDLLALRVYLTRESGSLALARDFTDRLRARCHALAELPGTLGRAREELAPGLRSLAWQDYVILFRYQAGLVQVVRILHGQRDLAALLPPEAGD